MNLLSEQPIFLFGCHKSGTSLLRALLDGHPDVLCIPKEAHFFQASGFAIGYPLREDFESENKKIFSLDQYRLFLKKENCEGSEFSDNPGFNYDIAAFENFYEESKIDSSLRGRFEAYMTAIIGSLGDSYWRRRKCRIVEKSVENFEFFPLLNAMYPQAKFIHIVRNPYATLCAIRKMKAEKGYPVINKFTSAIKQSMTTAWNFSALEDRYLVLRYEDLLLDPESKMREISSFLNLSFDVKLLQPTIGGRSWAGNSVYKEKY
ncbi:MAG: hypothetical protein DRR42_27580, partial [Gammaproteobacteria bacterium]